MTETNPEMENLEGEVNLVEELNFTIQEQIEQTQRDLREIQLMLGQSQGEVEKLSQRNANITMHLNQVESQLEDVPKTEIQNAYKAALDGQQRLVVMRSQLEKLQNDQDHLDRLLEMLSKVKIALDGETNFSSGGAASGNGQLATAEMMIQGQESERQRLSRQMHDGPAQTLSNFILQTEIAMRLFDIDQEKAKEELSSLKAAASTAFQQVRDFIFELRPMMLDDLGLVPTIRRYADVFRDKSGMEVSVSINGSERRLESYLEVMLFRTMQELINNTAAHSQASQLKIQLDMGIDEIRMVVEDNGKGLDPSKLEEKSGLGIKLINERADMLGGSFEIDSALGQGARFTLVLPAVEIE